MGAKGDSPAHAEAAFYRAFEAQDLAAMRAAWWDDDSVVCVHPGGPRLEGRDAVDESWRQILGQGARLHFEVVLRQAYETDELAVRVVDEVIRRPGVPGAAVVPATNAYRRTVDGWRIVLHHASPGYERQASSPLH